MPIWHAADLDYYNKDSCFNLVSSHEKVINLQVETWKHLLIIADSSLEAGPATIALADSDFHMLKACLDKSKRGLFKKDSLLIKCEDKLVRLSWRRSVTKTFLPVHFFKADRFLIRKSLKKYRTNLAETELSSSAAVLLELEGGESYFRQKIAHNYPLLVESLLSHNKEAFLNYCRNLVGLGRGLTPTGDDLLHGAFVAFHYFIDDITFMETVKKDFTAVAVSTNTFGRHVLEMGFRGLTPEMFGMLFRTIARGEADSKLLKRIISLGSSSGIDIAIAIFFFLGIIYE